MTPRRWIALIAFSFVCLPATSAAAAQDPPKADDVQPVPKMGFGRKADKTVLECGPDFFWHEVTYAVYAHDHMPDAPPVNIKIGDKKRAEPCRAPAPEHLPGPGTTLADAPFHDLKRRDDIQVDVCIEEYWHTLTYALFERWDDQDRPDRKILPIRILIKDDGPGLPCKPIETPKPEPATAGPDEKAGEDHLGTSHARSECGEDGVWHVISDEDWIRPDGTHFKQRHDKKTNQPCNAGDAIPPELPGGVQPVDKGEKIESKEVKECVHGIWWYVTYPQYRRADGTTWVDTGPDKWLSRMTKDEPCTGAGVAPGIMKMSRPSGFYVGAEYARNDSTLRTTKTLAETGQVVSDVDDAAGSNAFGGRAGKDVVFGGISVGGFGSFAWSPATAPLPTTITFTRATERWDAEVGGRGGVTTHGIFAYGLAGIGWVHREVEVGTIQGVTHAGATTTGVMAGGGVELGLRAALHVFVQYEVASWGDVTLDMPAAAPQFDYVFARHDHTFRFGVIVPIKR